MRLSKRRFPDTITRKRETPGHRNENGVYVPGSTETVDFAANVQPISLEDNEFVGGSQLSQRLTVYMPQADALVPEDSVDYDGHEFTVEESQFWQRSHTRAIILRET